MAEETRQAHWNKAYAEKGEEQVSWFEDRPDTSLALIRQLRTPDSTALIDIGGGASRLVDALLEDGWPSITVLDVSEAALDLAKARLGTSADRVEWIAADITKWMPTRAFDFWHDRAAFHFLTDPDARAAYVERLRNGVKPGGHAIIATFALDGPERCSGLPVERYDGAKLMSVVGPEFELVDERRHLHSTPWGSTQAFQYSTLRRRPSPA